MKLLSRRLFQAFALVVFVSLNLLQAQTKLQHPEWSKDAVIYEVNIRQYSDEGTFNAFTKRLPELKEMGIDILWLMPIHPIGEENRKGTLGSYYAVKDYLKVNPEFGTEDDFRNLVNAAHGLGMKVIIDWVANHTSWDNIWTIEHPEFFTRDENGNFVAPVDDWHDTIDLNYDNKDIWPAMTNALKYWVKEFGIDGYRCDVASMVPVEFWNQARKALDEIKPVFMLAESHEPVLHEAAFDMTYNWQFKDFANNVAKGKKTAQDFVDFLEYEVTKYPEDAYRMTFITNHDENTWDGHVFERLGDAAEVFSVLMCAVEGMPLVYSGQEAGMDKRLEFFEKDPIVWKEHKFRSLFTTMFKLKKENRALWNGESGGRVNLLYVSGDDNTLAFMREKGKDRVVCLFNLSGKDVRIPLESPEIPGNYKDVFNETDKSLTEKQTISLKPYQYVILSGK